MKRYIEKNRKLHRRSKWGWIASTSFESLLSTRKRGYVIWIIMRDFLIESWIDRLPTTKRWGNTKQIRNCIQLFCSKSYEVTAENGKKTIKTFISPSFYVLFYRSELLGWVNFLFDIKSWEFTITFGEIEDICTRQFETFFMHLNIFSDGWITF